MTFWLIVACYGEVPEKYRIDVGDSKGPQTRYATSDNWPQLVEGMTKRFKDQTLKIFVYANPEGTQEEENKGRYISSDYCTKVAAEINKVFGVDNPKVSFQEIVFLGTKS